MSTTIARIHFIKYSPKVSVFNKHIKGTPLPAVEPNRTREPATVLPSGQVEVARRISTLGDNEEGGRRR